MYKIETYIPFSSLKDIKEVLLSVDAGHIGNYRGCMTYYPVTGIWYSNEGSNPTIGQEGKWSEEPEYKIEVNVEDEMVRQTMEAIRKVHPYEEPVINLVKLMQRERKGYAPKKCLLVIDVQKEFKDKKGKYEEIIQYVKDNKEQYDKVIAVYCRGKP